MFTTTHVQTELNFPDQIPVGYKPKKAILSARNTVGYRGVSTNKGNKVVNYQSQITLGSRHVYIGNYDTIVEGMLVLLDINCIQRDIQKKIKNTDTSIVFFYARRQQKQIIFI